MSEKFLTFGAPQIEDGEIAEVVSCMKSGWLGTGPKVAKFEADFADYKSISTNQVAAVNSCTAALHVSMVAAGLPPGAEVITTPLTFCATVNAIIHAGLTPVLADIDPLTHCISPDTIAAAITPRTAAIVPVHYAGYPCEMDSIMALAAKHELVVIEDCAHAIETEYKAVKSGTLGDFGCFSFYVTKNLATGEGGMIVGKNAALIARAKTLALHGMSKDAWHRYSDKGYKHYQVVEAGFKYNMMDLQAAIGIHQLSRLDANWIRRLVIWQYYQDHFRNLPVALPLLAPSHSKHGLHLFPILIDPANCGFDRDDFLIKMHQRGIGTGVHYLSIPEHPFYQEKFGWRPESYCVAMKVGRQTVSLPLSAKLTDDDVERVVNAVRESFSA